MHTESERPTQVGFPKCRTTIDRVLTRRPDMSMDAHYARSGVQAGEYTVEQALDYIRSGGYINDDYQYATGDNQGLVRAFASCFDAIAKGRCASYPREIDN